MKPLNSLNCTKCGKTCKVKRIKMERGDINTETFKCWDCNRAGHRTVAHPDLSMQHKLKEYAAKYQEEHS